MPDLQGQSVDVQSVIAELTSNPLGAALWDRAQLAVLARKQAEELQYLRSLTVDSEGT
jgi:hypothetical protein